VIVLHETQQGGRVTVTQRRHTGHRHAPRAHAHHGPTFGTTTPVSFLQSTSPAAMLRSKVPPVAAGAGGDDDSGDEDTSRLTDVSEKAIKKACRLGLSNAERPAAWMRLANAADREDYYLSALEKVFGAGNIKPTKVYRVRRAAAACGGAGGASHTLERARMKPFCGALGGCAVCLRCRSLAWSPWRCLPQRRS
jgi:hypothetical protein